MTFIHDSYTAVGGRKNNEDALIISQRDPALLYVVADGLGGHDSGELASEMESLKKVHTQGLIHRDISPDNIMLVE